MRERMKRLSVLLVLVFMLQSILMSAVYAEETANVVMEMPASVNAENTNQKVNAESNTLAATTNPESVIQPYGYGTVTGSSVDLDPVKLQSANMLTIANLLTENIQADSITNSGSPTGSSQFKVYANNVTGGARSVKFHAWTQDGGRNLISNSSFNDSTTNGWYIRNATGGTNQVISNGWGGNKALEIKIANDGDQYQLTSFMHGADVGGRTFTYSAYIKTEGIQGEGIRLASYWGDYEGNWHPACWINQNFVQIKSGTNDWTRVTITTTAPPGAYMTTLIVYPIEKNGAGKYWISAAMMEENSQVTAYVNGKTKNILSNSSFNDSTTNGWYIRNATGGTNQVISNGWGGNKALEIKVANDGDQYQYTSFMHGTDVGGRTFTYSVYIKTEGIQGAGLMLCSYWMDSEYKWIPETWTTPNYVQTKSGTNDWTRVTITTTAPPGAYTTTLIVYPIEKNGAGKYWISGAMIEEGNNPTTYVSGTGVYEQDDAKWYDAVNTGDNNWNSTINIFNHFNESGKYLVEAFAYDENGKATRLGDTTVFVDKSLAQSIVSGKSVNCTQEIPFKLNLKLKNLKNRAGCTVTITYNPSDISAVTDLCKLTYKKETTTGTVAGTGITILKNEPGTIVFSVDKNIPDNKSWSGVANTIELKPAVSGQVTFTCKVE